MWQTDARRTRGVLCGLCLLATLLPTHVRFAHAGETDLVLASRVVDALIFSNTGTQIGGEVDDLVIRRNGKIKKITMEVGGFFDLGDKVVAVSPKRAKPVNGKVFIEVSGEQLKNKTDFDYDDRGLQPEYYYRWNPYYRPPHLRQPHHDPNWRSPPPQRPDRHHGGWARSPSRFLASVVMDRRLINPAGIPIGRVEDLLLDMHEHRVVKLVVSVKEFIKGGDVYLALPYMPLGFTPHGLIYDISLAELRGLKPYRYEE